MSCYELPHLHSIMVHKLCCVQISHVPEDNETFFYPLGPRGPVTKGLRAVILCQHCNFLVLLSKSTLYAKRFTTSLHHGCLRQKKVSCRTTKTFHKFFLAHLKNVHTIFHLQWQKLLITILGKKGGGRYLGHMFFFIIIIKTGMQD